MNQAQEAVPLAVTEQAEKAAGRARRRAVLRANAIRLVSLAMVLAAWEQYGRSVNPILFTYPTAIASSFVELALSGELWFYFSSSFQVMVYAALLSVAIGIPLGLLIARFPDLEHAIEAYINALYSTPMVALVPLLVLWFGFELKAKVVVVFLFAVFPILINTYQGVKSVDSRLLEVARSFCSRERQIWLDVVLPSSVPFIIAGLRLAVGRALVGMVVAEFFTSITGLGYMIVRYANSYQTDKLFVPVILLMVMGIVLMEGLKHLQGRVAPWTRQTDEG